MSSCLIILSTSSETYVKAVIFGESEGGWGLFSVPEGTKESAIFLVLFEQRGKLVSK